MGMYTALHYNVELKRDVPDEVVALLRYMTGEEGVPEPEALPDHPLFGNTRWRHMLQCDSYYFRMETHSAVRYDRIARSWFLHVQSNLKNYSGEIEDFVDWMDPYVQAGPGEWLGYRMYEEAEVPTNIHKEAS